MCDHEGPHDTHPPEYPFFLLAVTLLLLQWSCAFSIICRICLLALTAHFAILGLLMKMESNTYQTPDLASVLRALAVYGRTQGRAPNQAENASTYDTESRRHDSELEGGEYEPAVPAYDLSSTCTPLSQAQTEIDAQAQAQAALQPRDIIGYDPVLPLITENILQTEPATPVTQPASSDQLQESPQQSPPPTKIIPPPPKKKNAPPQNYSATITTYAPALRHVTALTYSNAEFTNRIRQLIKTQHDHERQWWNVRQELIKKSNGRKEQREMLDSVLASLGSKAQAITDNDVTPEKELEIYDQKVYKACKEMVTATSGELAKLEVPFFCTMKGLVTGKGTSKKKGTITEDDLVEMQKRMMGLLEDLCCSEE